MGLSHTALHDNVQLLPRLVVGFADEETSFNIQVLERVLAHWRAVFSLELVPLGKFEDCELPKAQGVHIIVVNERLSSSSLPARVPNRFSFWGGTLFVLADRTGDEYQLAGPSSDFFARDVCRLTCTQEAGPAVKSGSGTVEVRHARLLRGRLVQSG